MSIDGFHGPFLHALQSKAKLPEGYVPVGFSLYVGEPGPGSMFESATPLLERHMSVRVFASDEIPDPDGNAVRDHVGEYGSVRVESFDSELTLEDFFKLVKRFDIVAKSRTVDGGEMVSPTGE